MWSTKTFTTRKELESFKAKNQNRLQMEEIFINNGFCLEYRKLRKVY